LSDIELQDQALLGSPMGRGDDCEGQDETYENEDAPHRPIFSDLAAPSNF
jgi:hypothetical protein